MEWLCGHLLSSLLSGCTPIAPPPSAAPELPPNPPLLPCFPGLEPGPLPSDTGEGCGGQGAASVPTRGWRCTLPLSGMAGTGGPGDDGSSPGECLWGPLC